MKKEFISEEVRIPKGYEIVGEPPVELRDFFKSLREGIFPTINSFPFQITLNQALDSFLQAELQTALENRRMEMGRFLFHRSDVGIIAGKWGEASFGVMKVVRAGRQTLEKYNLKPLGPSHAHPYQRKALFSREDLTYFLSYPEDFLMVVVSEEGTSLVLKSQETSQGPVPLEYYYGQIEPYLQQLFKLSETEALKELREESPEISGEDLLPSLRPLAHSKFNLRVAKDFSLGLYSSRGEDFSILNRVF